VGSYYMQKAEISDKGSAIAQSVFSDLMARGMLNPRAWYVMTPNPLVNPTGNWDTQFSSDGKYSSLGTAKAGTFTRPFALALGEALNQPTTAADPLNRLVLAKQFGSAFVIDPLGVSVLAFGILGSSRPTNPRFWAGCGFSRRWISGVFPLHPIPNTEYVCMVSMVWGRYKRFSLADPARDVSAVFVGRAVGPDDGGSLFSRQRRLDRRFSDARRPARNSELGHNHVA